jgi:hypothetical protein
VVARCGDVGQNGNGGHAHNDLLSYELSDGFPFVVDSGTYVYTADPDARNLFRSTAAHNTVVVGGEEINPIARSSLFRLRQFANPTVEQWEETAERIRFVASHDGYRRLDPPVVHRRTFSLERPSDELEVLDELLGDGRQSARSFIHLAPDVTVVNVSDADWELQREGVARRIRFEGFDEVGLTEGWVSDRFGTRTRAPVLVGSITGALPLRFGYRIAPTAIPAATEDGTTGRLS